MKKQLITLLLLGACIGAQAQFFVEIKPTKKIIHVDELGMSPNTGVLDVLQAMPELLNRSSSDYFANYGIQVDGKDVGQSRDVVLEQTKLVEVDVIEISTSPTVSEQKNGTGGVINIKMKPVTTEGVSGDVLLDASTGWGVAPSVLLNYKKNKFTLRSSVMIEHWHPKEFKETNTSLDQVVQTRINQLDTIGSHYCQETAKLHLQWNPTERDEVKLFAWESFGNEYKKMYSGETSMSNSMDDPQLWRETRMLTSSEGRGRQLTTEAQLSYKHGYRAGGEFKIEATYSYNPLLTWELHESRYANISTIIIGNDGADETKKNNYPQQFMGEISTKHLLLPAGSPHSLDVKIGANTNYGFGRSEYAKRVTGGRYGAPDTINSNTVSLFVSPYMEWNYAYNGWTLQLGGRYHYYRNGQQDDGGSPASYVNGHTWTGNLSVMWQIAEQHHLRFVTARNITRTTDMDNAKQLHSSIFPYYNAGLDYTFNWNNDVDYVMTNAGLEYVYVKHATYDTGVLSANLQLVYRHNIFSLAFAGNVYAKRDDFFDNSAPSWRLFYNLSLTPVFSFRKNWTLSGKLMYNSEIFTPKATYGDCWYAQLRLSKDIRNWNIHVQLNDIFDYDTYNIYHMENGDKMEQLDLYKRCIQIGFGYKF